MSFILNQIDRESGITLMELLLALSIVAILFLSFGRVSVTLMGVWAREESNMAVMQKGQLAMEKITSDIRKARKIIIPQKNRLKFQGLNQDGDLIWMEYRFYFSSSVPALGLQKGGSILPIINNVSSINFYDKNGDKSIIQVQLELNAVGDKKIMFSNCVNPLYEGGL